MAKHEKTVVDVEVKTIVKKSVYKFELSSGEVHFIRWLLDHGVKPSLFTADSGLPVGSDGIRLKNLRSFWPTGIKVGGGLVGESYDAATMFKSE